MTTRVQNSPSGPAASAEDTKLTTVKTSGAAAFDNCGGKHERSEFIRGVVDADGKVVTTPAHMLAPSLKGLAVDAAKPAAEVLRLVNRPAVV